MCSTLHVAWCFDVPGAACACCAPRSPGQVINQNGKLFSPSGQYFLSMTYYGSVALTNTALFIAQSPQANVWSTNTYSSNGPFSFTFQVSLCRFLCET